MRPIMRLLDVLGQRWSLRLLWELRDGPQSFRGLRAKTDDLSPSILNARMKALRGLGLVQLTGAGYELTPRGEELGKLVTQLDVRARAWDLEDGGWGSSP